MASFVANLFLFSFLYHVVIYGAIVGKNDCSGVGVSAFSFNTRVSSRLRSTTPKSGSSVKRIGTIESRSCPFSSTTIYANNPFGSVQEKTKKIESTTTKDDDASTKSDDSSNDLTDDEQSPPQMQQSKDISRPFALLLASQFLLFIGVGAVIPSIPLYGKEIGLSGVANGLVISAPAVALFLGANWSGRRADIARKPAMMIGMAIIAVSDIGTAAAQGIYTLVLARLGLGAGRALSEAGERGMLVDLANQIPEMRGRALAAQQAVVALGIAIGAPAGGLVVEKYGPRAAFLCVSAAAITALVLYAFLPETVVRSPSSSPTAAAAAVVSTSDFSPTAAAEDPNPREEETLNENTAGVKVWAELLKQNDWKGLTLCQSGSSFGFAAKIASIPILAAGILPGGAAGAGALLSAAGLSGLVGAPVGGFVTDRIGAKGAAVISGVVSGIGLMLVPVSLQIIEGGSPSMEVSLGGVQLQTKELCFSLAVLLWSLGVSAQGPSLTALAQQKSLAGVEATSLSLLKAAGDGTYIVAPLILGLVADALVDYPGIECALAGSTTLLGTVALAGFVRGEGEKQKDPNQNIM